MFQSSPNANQFPFFRVAQQPKQPKQRKVREHFNKYEDKIILDFVFHYGEKNLAGIVSYLPNRSLRQIKERYKNYLKKDVDLTPFSKEEDDKLIHLVAEKGNMWADIAIFFPGRTDVKLKNRYTLLKRRKISMTYDQHDCDEAKKEENKYKKSSPSSSDFKQIEKSGDKEVEISPEMEKPFLEKISSEITIDLYEKDFFIENPNEQESLGYFEFNF
jgi:hypothetical protein